MHLGFSLYQHMLRNDCIDENLAFAKQCGASHIIVHLVDYFHQGQIDIDSQPIGDEDGCGVAGSKPHVWEYSYFQWLKNKIEEYDLTWYAVENFDPSDWYAILLGEPERGQQIKKLQQIIRDLGRAGVRCMGYNFSLAGVAARSTGPYARGGAASVGMEGTPSMSPIPQGMIWNMIYDLPLYRQAKREGLYQNQCCHEELWQRLSWFLEKLVPAAAEAGVMLCAHPDDPPLEWVRHQARLVYQPEMYQRLIDINDSDSNGLDLCLGTLQEMQGNEPSGEIFPFLESYLEQERVGYIHLRNVQGKIPHYKEVFIDEGDLDIKRVLATLKKWHFQGVIVPDHAPQMSCKAPWYAGMAFTMGYLKALL